LKLIAIGADVDLKLGALPIFYGAPILCCEPANAVALRGHIITVENSETVKNNNNQYY